MPDSSEQAFPNQGRLLGLDYGTRRIGLAISNPEQTIASPLENYTRVNETHDAKHLARVAAEYRVAGLIVGLPLHALSGDEGEKAKEARAFGTWVAAATKLPVCYHDERYTSAIAEERLREADFSKKKIKAKLDKLAAQIMLQSFLEGLGMRG